MDEISAVQLESVGFDEDIRLCARCGQEMISLVRCQQCGDRLEDSHALTPYQRLGLSPKPIYLQAEVDLASDLLLAQLHVLRSSRLLASWSLKQRALVRRDASMLSRLSGGLQTFLQERFRRGLDETILTRAYKQQARDVLSAPSGGPARLFLLLNALHELKDLDGYQERERLLNRISRELRKEAIIIARQITSNRLEKEDLPTLIKKIKHLDETERWLDAQRFDTAQSRRS